MIDPQALIYCALAAYAATRYITKEDGPGDVLKKLRALVGSKGAGWKKWITCPFCFLVSAVLVLFVLVLVPYVQWIVSFLAVLGLALVVIDTNSTRSAAVKQQRIMNAQLSLLIDVIGKAFTVDLTEEEDA